MSEIKEFYIYLMMFGAAVELLYKSQMIQYFAELALPYPIFPWNQYALSSSSYLWLLIHVITASVEVLSTGFNLLNSGGISYAWASSAAFMLVTMTNLARFGEVHPLMAFAINGGMIAAAAYLRWRSLQESEDRTSSENKYYWYYFLVITTPIAFEILLFLKYWAANALYLGQLMESR